MGVCQRCGVSDPDTRTLWMACLYQMSEIRDVPFEEAAIDGVFKRQVGEKVLPNIGISVPVFKAKEDAKPFEYKFYLLKVCKDCRADWMTAIRNWFVVKPVEEEINDGVLVRVLGTERMMTKEEYDEFRKQRGD